MRIGVPKEVKVHEYRVGLVPASAREAVAHGHEVFVQAGAAERMGIGDDDYRRVGAVILPTAEDVFATGELIVKVKEPLAAERAMLRQGQTLFTYLLQIAYASLSLIWSSHRRIVTFNRTMVCAASGAGANVAAACARRCQT